MVKSPLSLAALLSVVAASQLSAQVAPPKSTGPRVEPGLEAAVKWKWRVLPSDPKDWGLELPVRVPTQQAPPIVPGVSRSVPTAPAATMASVSDSSGVYVVKKGDVLVRIAKQFGISVYQLKTFNGLTTDMIHIGQEIKIPSADELKAMPMPTPVEKKTPEGKVKPTAPPKPEQRWKPGTEMDNLALQIFLDREHFSVGPIDAKANPTFQHIAQIYMSVHSDTPDMDALRVKTQIAIRDVFAHYVLKEEDFRFIAAPKAEKYNPNAVPTPTPTPPPAKGKGKGGKHAPASSLERAWTYEEMTGATMLAYRSPWQFVAERFHCDEKYLRSLNDKLKDQPAVGTDFRVPNVVPFEIENALDAPLQPPANPQVPVRAEVQDLNVIQIFQGDRMVAAMPLSVARPGLKGRDTWTVLAAIPRPKLATLQELANPPSAPPRLFGAPEALPSATPVKAALTSEQFLPAGPKNPVGIIWINLAKSGSNEPLPYGLHGTSIPDRMTTQESLGGFRLTNWDIASAVRMLPVGTALVWKQQRAAAPASAAVPAAVPASPATPAIPVNSTPVAVPVSTP